MSKNIKLQSATISLVVAHTGELANASRSDFVAYADEIIEVTPNEDPLLQGVGSAGVVFRHIKQRGGGVVHALNLGISFATSDWVVVSFGDEVMACGWLEKLRFLLMRPQSDSIFLFSPRNAVGIPLVVVSRQAFVYGPFDEDFLCGRLAALHWVFHIFPSRPRRILPNEGVRLHDCDFIEDGSCPPIEAPLAGLVELWHELKPDLRHVLLEQAVADPESTRESLLFLRDVAEKVTKEDVNPNYSGSYDVKHFWDSNLTSYIRWEVYQPDEPEILILLSKITFGSVLELGCGAGRNTRFFASAEHYVGIDISRRLLDRAVERQEPNSIGILCGDICDLPYIDASFDLVFSDSSVQHVAPDRIFQCVAEIVRVSTEYICLIEYTEEECEGGEWFNQIHMFAHDYRTLFEPYCDLVWHTETSLRVHPACKEVFLFKKRCKG